jgi:hypothetical protein
MVGILGNYATICRQRGDNGLYSSDTSRDFALCQEILNIDKIILERYTLCCRQNVPDDAIFNDLEKFKQLLCLEGNLITTIVTNPY